MEETVHLQGVVQFKNAREFSALKSAVNRAHWEKCRDVNKSKRYCCKPEGRLEGPWHSPDVNIQPLEDIKLDARWQKQVVEYIDTHPPCPRTINWIVDAIGGAGKTNLCKYLRRKYGGIYISGGKANDIKYAVATQVEANGYPAIILFDFPRTCEGHVSYQSIEELRNGLFFSTKYESKTAEIPPCHIWCFSNFHPDESSLSSDRWNIIRLGERDRADTRRTIERFTYNSEEKEIGNGEAGSETDVDEEICGVGSSRRLEE